MVESEVERSKTLVILGWLTMSVLYLGQVGLLASFLATHSPGLYLLYFLSFLLPIFCYCCWVSKAEEDGKIVPISITWGMYIALYIVTIVFIFSDVAQTITKQDTIGQNTLLGTLCITPALLVLLLQLAICPSYRKDVLSMSLFAALNIFDGIEMLEIFLMQKEGHFDLDSQIERCIVFFACLTFFFSIFDLARNKLGDKGVLEERGGIFTALGLFEIACTNLSFLVLRAITWNKYEAAIFMAKNIIALVMGVVQFTIVTEIFKCG